MSRTPNEEQLKAINHNGGVLLSAGAGSGKTFVLVNHLYKLTKDLFEKGGFEAAKIYFEKVVIMTFTKKAAGELKQRVKQEFLNFRTTYTESEIEEVLNSIKITTIHGFCNSLIKKGLISSVDINTKLLSEIEYGHKINTLIDSWYEQSQLTNEMDSFYAYHEYLFKDSMKNVFSDPLIRMEWDKDILNQNDSYLFNELLIINNYKLLKENIIDLESYLKFKDKKWFQYLTGFNKILSLTDPIEVIKKSAELFQEYSRVIFPRKDDLLSTYNSQLKIFREFIKKHNDEFSIYINNKDIFLSWHKLSVEIFNYIEEYYFNLEGISYADMEYFLKKDIINSPSKFKNKFNYFIVDEFQDTSPIQFEIIKELIGSDFNKLFCVGDIKQAIYGFRGGELQVFKDTSKLISKSLNLVNNYRSLSNLINFNNIFFDNIFQKGYGFKNKDPYSVPVIFQNVPNSEAKDKGTVNSFKVNLSNSELKKIGKIEIEVVEAKKICRIIKQLISDNKSNICILYKNLTPSKYIINELIENQIAFSAQFKVSYNKDFIINVFNLLIEELLSEKSTTKSITSATHFLINEFERFLYGDSSKIAVENIVNFKNNYKLFGLYDSFKLFLIESNTIFSSYDPSLKIIKNLCDNYSFNLSELYSSLLKLSDKNYSFNFQYLANREVTLMTTHSSKGLEFDHVILGGIHTNGSIISNKDLLGKYPGSIKWKMDMKDKQYLRAPQYVLENTINKYKNFSESKRLFYVACTRAIKGLYWVDVSLNGEPQKYSDSSWIVALRESICSQLDKIINYEIEEVIYKNEQNNSLKNSPLFHIDTIGFTQKLIKSSVVISSELSVTKMASIVNCNKKYFLKNICKLEENFKRDESDLASVVNRNHLVNSADRGTEIHQLISDFINEKEISSDNIIKYKTIFSWIEVLKVSIDSNTNFSEKILKFDFLGQMITGIPDFYSINKKNKSCFIWDFKTGRSNISKLDGYWFQLKMYAYALFKLKMITKDTKVIVSLLFVDEENKIDKEISYIDIESFLKEIKGKMQKLGLENRDHCSSCGYGNLCLIDANTHN